MWFNQPSFGQGNEFRQISWFAMDYKTVKKYFWVLQKIRKKFGKKGFWCSFNENALTGVSIGAAISGVRSVVTHQRLDFLLAMDQLVNSASKWHFMLGTLKVPIQLD